MSGGKQLALAAGERTPQERGYCVMSGLTGVG
jgi:hypothetical protein